jgi:hypothetical protein
VFNSVFPSASLSFSFIFYPFDVTFSAFLSYLDFRCTSPHFTSISVFIFLSPAFPLHALEIAIAVFCVYVNYIHFSFLSRIFSYSFLPLFFLCLLEFQPTFLSTCQVQLPSICYVSSPLLDLRPLFQKHLDFCLIRERTEFSYTVQSFYTIPDTFIVFVSCKKCLNTKEQMWSNALVKTKVNEEEGCAYMWQRIIPV